MKKQTRNLIIAAATLIIIVACALVLWKTLSPKPTTGSKSITVEIVHKNETKKTVKIKTDAEYLRGALEQENLIDGVDSEYGLYVTTVDGEHTDDSNQEWWCFTRNGVMLDTGVDTTPVTDGEKYEITFTVGW